MEKDLIRALDEMGNLADQYLRERDAAEARVAELEAWLAKLTERESVLKYGALSLGCWREYKDRLTRARAAIARKRS